MYLGILRFWAPKKFITRCRKNVDEKRVKGGPIDLYNVACSDREKDQLQMLIANCEHLFTKKHLMFVTLTVITIYSY